MGSIVEIIAFVIVPAFLMVVILSCCKVSGDCSRAEEQSADPCEKCIRWSECNGVDKDCPWRGGNGTV